MDEQQALAGSQLFDAWSRRCQDDIVEDLL